MSHEEAKRIIRERLRACWWGPRTTVQGAAHEGMGFRQAEEGEWAPGFEGEDTDAPSSEATESEAGEATPAEAAAAPKAAAAAAAAKLPAKRRPGRPATSPAPAARTKSPKKGK